MLHNLTVNEEKYFDFVFGEVSIDVFVVELNWGVEKGLPGLFRLGHFTDINRVVEDLLDFDVMGHFVIVIDLVLIESFPKDGVNTFHGNFDSFYWSAWLFIQILKTIVDLLFLADFDALVNREISVVLESLEQLIRFHSGHQFNVTQNGLLGQFVLVGAERSWVLVASDDLFQIIQLQLLVVR